MKLEDDGFVRGTAKRVCLWMSSALPFSWGVTHSRTWDMPLPSKCLTSWAHVLIEDAREARVENDLLGCRDVCGKVTGKVEGKTRTGRGTATGVRVHLYVFRVL